MPVLRTSYPTNQCQAWLATWNGQKPRSSAKEHMAFTSFLCPSLQPVPRYRVKGGWPPIDFKNTNCEKAKMGRKRVFKVGMAEMVVFWVRQCGMLNAE